MFRPVQPATPRKGVILLVVLSMLMLFALVGISFVIYASAQASTNRTLVGVPSQQAADMEPEQALALVLGKLIYDESDDAKGVWSALRGHSLARNMYGYNKDDIRKNDTPYSGVGRLHVKSYPDGSSRTPFFPTQPRDISVGIVNPACDDAYLCNYMYFESLERLERSQPLPIRDPERYGTRTPPSSYRTPEEYANYFSNNSQGPFVAANPSYTYADYNNLFLAAVKADGTVLKPSFQGSGFGSLRWDPDHTDNPTLSNPYWRADRPEGRYLTLRPRPIDNNQDPAKGGTFPYPGDAFGDVKNLPWAPGGNDSIWIDVNAPVMTAPNGQRYKMLVAPLIMDLDGRVNLNVHGNVMGSNNTHNSNQGWGPWEVNLSKVLDYPPGGTPTEWQNVLRGKVNPAGGSPPPLVRLGKYGAGPDPSLPTLPRDPIPPTQVRRFDYLPHPYAPADYKGRGADSGRTPPLLPGEGTAVPYQNYVSYPNYYRTSSTSTSVELDAEFTRHAGGFNPMLAPANITAITRDNLVFSLADLAALLRGDRDTGSEALNNSQLVQLLPKNLNSMDATNHQLTEESRKRRNLITPYNFVLDRPSGTPYIFTPGPTTGAVPFPIPDPITRGLPTRLPPSGDFDANWRSAVAKYGKINLNRTLTEYPSTVATDAEKKKFHEAELDRQLLAKDIFDRLCWATGAPNPFALIHTLVVATPTEADPWKVTQEQFDAVRSLAQYAANMVDYIDSDDYNTVFVWNPADPAAPDPWLWMAADGSTNFANIDNGVVFGVEPPKLVLNEGYVEYENNSVAQGYYQVYVWIELLNPFMSERPAPTMSDPTPQDKNTVHLVQENANPIPNHNIYQIMLAQSGISTDPFTVLDRQGNPIPDQRIPQEDGFLSFPVTNFRTSDRGDVGINWQVEPVGSAFQDTTKTNKGFYVLGPNPPLRFPNAHPNSAMSYVLQQNNWNRGPMILLRRLLYPNRPPNPASLGGTVDTSDLTKNPYNPYITVDVVAQVPGNNANLDMTGVPVSDRKSYGRREPYDAELVAMDYPNAGADLPKHSFYRHNYPLITAPDPHDPPNTAHTLQIPFHPLIHLDRELISPMELLQVSACSPARLTHAFVGHPIPVMDRPSGGGDLFDPYENEVDSEVGLYKHLVPWFTQSNRLYRFFDMVETRSRVSGVAEVGGRVPGKININSIWDEETFLALCDAQPSNKFFNSDSTLGNSDFYVRKLFHEMLISRNANYRYDTATGTESLSSLSLDDRPFKSFGVGPAISPATSRDALDPYAIIGDPATPPNSFRHKRGLRDTLLRLPGAPAAPTGGRRLFDPNTPGTPGIDTHPYQQMELLTKIYNNLTTRSNTFAVFLTVGFFEVTDETARPVTLGAEIGADAGKNIRHRMFAIVDRTNLKTFETTTNAAIDPPTNPLTNYAPFQHPMSLVSAPFSSEGVIFVYEPNTANEESVVLSKYIQGSPVADFLKPHRSGVRVIIRGNNPVPQLLNGYDPRKDTEVVPFFEIID